MSKAGKWNNASLTPDGQELQARLLNGGGFEFTKATAADETGVDKLTLTMQPPVVSGNKITVPVLLSNMGLDAGFTMTQLRFYARKTGGTLEEEVLYAIAQDNTGDYIPSAVESAGFTSDWSYTFQFGNADTVNVSIDPAGLVSLALLGAPGGIATLDEGGKLPKAQLTEITGDDIPTSASDPTSISSQLSNRLRTPVEIPADADLNDYKIPGMYYCAVDAIAETIANCPTPHAFTLLVEKLSDNDSIQTFKTWCDSNGYNATVFVRSGYPNWGNGWRQLATATPPQEFDLPLAEGVGDSAKYSKDQLGRVQLRGWITGATADTVVATLPAGFRPASAAHFIQAISSSSQCGIARVIVRPDGTIYVELPQNGTLANGLSLQLSFLAG